jgi:hypothetical protein
MMDDSNPDNIGNHLEAYGYEGWPDRQEENEWDLPEQDRPEPEYYDD